MSFISTDIISDFDKLKKFEANRIVQAIGTSLRKHYPDYGWSVSVNMDGGIANITAPSISTEYGMVIHIDKHVFDLEDAALKAGGELLERFNMKRDGYTDASHLQKDLRGNAVAASQGGL